MKIKKSDLNKLIKEAVRSQIFGFVETKIKKENLVSSTPSSSVQKKTRLMESAKMTRQHFQLIADVLKNTNAPENVKTAFAEALAQTNPGFKKDVFLKAAGGVVPELY